MRLRSVVCFPLGCTICALLPVAAQASGFALIEQSASGLGSAFAGSASTSNDSSVQFFNPAGLIDLDAAQAVLAGHAIDVHSKFRNRGSTLPPAGLGALPVGKTQDDAGSVQGVPNLYLSTPLSARVALGLGVNAPFGLKTEYDDPWVGRFQGIETKVTTLNINPSVAVRLSDAFSVGAGLDYQKLDAILTNAVMLGAGVEGRARLDVGDHAWSWNAGALFVAPGGVRVGLGYRAKIDYQLTGTTSVTTLAGTAIPAAGGATSAALTLPDSATLSVTYPLSRRWDLYGDLSYTLWSKLKQIDARNAATGTPRDILDFRFDDTWRYAFGAAMKASETWTVRYGFAVDQSPVKDAARTVRLPDADRIWASVGAQWKPGEQWSVDAGYAHLFIDNPPINLTRAQVGAPASFASVVAGDYDSSVDIVSLQLTYRLK